MDGAGSIETVLCARSDARNSRRHWICANLDHKVFFLPSITVEDLPISFSPFSLADCTMLDHFSFNDFVAIAFLDIAGDLDIQI